MQNNNNNNNYNNNNNNSNNYTDEDSIILKQYYIYNYTPLYLKVLHNCSSIITLKLSHTEDLIFDIPQIKLIYIDVIKYTV